MEGKFAAVPYTIYDYDGMGGQLTREGLMWLEQRPPGVARCSCGELATEIMWTGGSGAARYVGCFEAFCGQHDHLEGPFHRWLGTLKPEGARWQAPW